MSPQCSLGPLEEHNADTSILSGSALILFAIIVSTLNVWIITCMESLSSPSMIVGARRAVPILAPLRQFVKASLPPALSQAASGLKLDSEARLVRLAELRVE